MSNQVILWSFLLMPWLTLFLMKKEDIKRFMPVALFGAITSVIIGDIGINLNLWAGKEFIFPLKINPISLGLYPVLIMWLFKFTYERFWRYISAELVLNLGFSFILVPWLISRGIREHILATNLSILYITTIQGLFLYVYQMWQEDALVPAIKKYLIRPQPVATKLLVKDKNEERDDRN